MKSFLTYLKEEQSIISSLSKIKTSSVGKVKFNNGKTETIDGGTANLITTAYNKLSKKEQQNFEKDISKSPSSLFKMLDKIT